LAGRPDLALAKARQAQAAGLNTPEVKWLIGAALRRAGDPSGAATMLQLAAAGAPGAWGVQYELGGAYAALGETAAAVKALTRATTLNPKFALAWHALADQLAIQGDQVAAEAARARRLPGGVTDAVLQDGARALFRGDLARADAILKDRFGLHPTDVLAVRLLADAAMRMKDYAYAEGLLRPLLEAAPKFMPARSALAEILLARNDPQGAVGLLDGLLAQAPGAGLFLGLRGAARLQIGEYAGAVADFEAALDQDPRPPRIWVRYGHSLRIVGRRAEAVAAYRRSLDLEPTLGEAYWSLANLKVVRFDAGDLDAMRTALDRPGLSEEDRANLHYALGKALEDEGRYEASFEQYDKGAAIRRAQWPYDAEADRRLVERSIRTFTPDFFAARRSVGHPAADPIFVVGLHRSGSTLVEQMLASHSQVEGVSELSDLTAIAGILGATADPAATRASGAPDYPAGLGTLDVRRFAELGAEFLDRTRVHRKLGRPFFVDKLPNNFIHIGLIHLILPNAKIIDVRRQPLACGLSVFKQNFARGAQYSYSLSDIGRYYRRYAALTAHFDAVLPGRVHRVQYERLVEDPEGELRRLLEYCGLAFEPECLRFHESDRPVRTASSEQVRQPLFKDGVDQWRNFEPWLEPLKRALGPDLTAAEW